MYETLSQVVRIWHGLSRRLGTELAGLRARMRKRAGGRHPHALVLTIVVTLHASLLLMFTWSLRAHVAREAERELKIMFFRSAPDIAPPPVDPDSAMPVIAPPEIIIEDDATNSAPAAALVSMVLAPRPDPAHPNIVPGGIDKASAGNVLAVILKILVLPDGTVGDAQIAKASGDATADAAAMAYVSAHWRFMPAQFNGTAIKYWTSVSVPIARSR